jgi:hypothetical protein
VKYAVLVTRTHVTTMAYVVDADDEETARKNAVEEMLRYDREEGAPEVSDTYEADIMRAIVPAGPSQD